MNLVGRLRALIVIIMASISNSNTNKFKRIECRRTAFYLQIEEISSIDTFPNESEAHRIHFNTMQRMQDGIEEEEEKEEKQKTDT